MNNHEQTSFIFSDFFQQCKALIIYHFFCVSLVAIALRSGWLLMEGGGSFAWELWALWQQSLGALLFAAVEVGRSRVLWPKAPCFGKASAESQQLRWEWVVPNKLKPPRPSSSTSYSFRSRAPPCTGRSTVPGHRF